MEIDWIRVFRTTSAMCFSIILILSIVGYFFLLQPQIPLFYSLARVEDQLTSKLWVFIFPGLGAVSMLVERIFSPILKEEHTALKVLSFGCMLVLLFLCTALIRVMMVTT